jgi:hypothetical protein
MSKNYPEIAKAQARLKSKKSDNEPPKAPPKDNIKVPVDLMTRTMPTYGCVYTRLDCP